MAFGSYEVGVLQRTPVPSLTPSDESTLSFLARRAWSVKRALDTRTENSHAFSHPALLQSLAGTFLARAAAWAARIRIADVELSAIQAEIDDRCFDLYGIAAEDRRAITGGFGGTVAAAPTDDAECDAVPALVSSSASKPAPSAGPADNDSDADDSDESATGDATALTADLLSWSIGVAFGRFDLRLATGERALPPEPDPFDPLPVCSPGMLTGADGLPCVTAPPGYPIDFPPDGVLLDDPGHPRDLTASVRAVFDVVFGGDADARWQEAAGILDAKNHDVRAFVARTFFEQHLKRYSKSRRKAPIYWQLATPSGSYSVWLYAHRLTPDTYFHVLHDVVAPKLGLEERKLLSLAQDSGPNLSASQRKEIAAQGTFVDELRAFRDEVTRVAPLWKPDLDDGVVLTMAPLWRLVPQHRAWQKELKAAWDSLCSGEYDWAHVAMHLWPERVVPKCATDRSLAISHGLEEVFWEEDAKGKWAARKTPVTPVATLVAERTSPAVKAALKDLLEAPVPGGAARTTGRGKRRTVDESPARLRCPPGSRSAQGPADRRLVRPEAGVRDVRRRSPGRAGAGAGDVVPLPVRAGRDARRVRRLVPRGPGGRRAAGVGGCAGAAPRLRPGRREGPEGVAPDGAGGGGGGLRAAAQAHGPKRPAPEVHGRDDRRPPRTGEGDARGAGPGRLGKRGGAAVAPEGRLPRNPGE